MSQAPPHENFVERRLDNVAKLVQYKENIILVSYRDPSEIPSRYLEIDCGSPDSSSLDNVLLNKNMYVRLALSMCNKLSYLYWSHDAQIQIGPIHPRKSARKPCADMWTEWLRCNDGAAFDLSLSLAHTFLLRPEAPHTILELVALHLVLCESAERRLGSKIPPGYQQLNPKLYKVLFLCRALMAILDQRVPGDSYNDVEYPPSPPSCSSEQNLLLIRTGCEADMSTPIEFLGLSQHTLPLERDDVPEPKQLNTGLREIQTVHIPLPVAVKFLWRL